MPVAVDAVVNERSLQSTTETVVPKPSRLLLINSRLVLTGIAALLAISVTAIAFPDLAGSAAGYLGAVLGIMLFLPFGLAVFLSVDRRSLRATRAVALLFFGAAGLALFGVVSNVTEALYCGEAIGPTFLVIFTGTGLGIAAYFTASGIAFRKWQGELEAASGSPRRKPLSSTERSIGGQPNTDQ